MKQEFKAGDKVYCPLLGTKVYQIEYVKNCQKELVIKNHRLVYFFDETGNPNMNYKDSLPFIFHATPENHELLCKLYGVEFEAPPKPKTPKEVIQAMLDDGWEYVPLLTPIKDDETEEITRLFPVLVSKSMWQNPKITHEIHALLFQNGVPVDPKTGKIIIDYIDGEIVTE
ncbi:hypothetical protein [Moraxella bovoculi]|uniref:hypothetical protein n=1 Tax=Moraxella bovoculi TaxID=386891 RepID=UPI0009BA5386|nr:hypothetical protein [Moraxella bovoculi]